MPQASSKVMTRLRFCNIPTTSGLQHISKSVSKHNWTRLNKIYKCHRRHSRLWPACVSFISDQDVCCSTLRFYEVQLLFVQNFNDQLTTIWKLVYITTTRLFKYIENFKTQKKGKFSDKKKIWYFSYSCSRHRLWVLVRIATARRF